MKIYRSILLVIFWHLSLGQKYVLAGIPPEIQQQLDEQLETVDKYLSAYVRESFNYNESIYFLNRLTDFVVTTVNLSNLASNATNEITNAHEKWSKVKSQLILQQIGEEEASFEIMQPLSTIARAQGTLEIIKNDFGILSDSWKNRCSDDVLGKFSRIFRPMYLYELPDFDFDLNASSNVNLKIGISMQGESSGGPNLNGSGKDSIGTVIGGGIGALVGGPVGSAIGAVVGYFSQLFFENKKIAKMLKTETDYMKRYREVHKDFLTKFDADYVSNLKGRCDSGLSDPEDQIQNTIVGYSKLIETLYQEASRKHAQVQADSQEIQTRYINHLLRIDDTYLGPLKKNYLEKLENNRLDQKQMTSQIHDFIKNEIGLHLANWKKGFRSKQDLWNDLIKGESRFSDSDDFVLGPEAETKEVNLWISTRKILKRELQR